MQLIDGSRSHPIQPPPGGITPPSDDNVGGVIDIAPNETWAGKVPPNVCTDVGSDAVVRVVNVEDLERDPWTQLMESSTGAFLQNVLGYAPRVEAISSGTFTHSPDSAGLQTNMLLAAADVCFQAHIPFGLRPEVLWATILSQVAAEVKSPETYRHLFTRSEGKETMVVVHNGLHIGSPYGWDQAIGMFENPLRERIPSSLAQDCMLDVSTCGNTERIANLVILMDAASPYYDYIVRTLCGIPRVALFGTADDWERLAVRVTQLEKSFPALRAYFMELHPILAKIVSAARGETVDPWFWKSLYKRNSGSGGDTLTGWLTAFFLFLADRKGVVSRRTDFEWDHQWHGISPAAFPSSVSKVPFVWDYLGTHFQMNFVGGVLTTVDIDGFLTPRLGWAVVHEK